MEADSKAVKLQFGNAYIQIVGSATRDTTPSLYFFTDNQRYIFNCGEGTQRLFNQNKIKLSRIGQIFFTRLCWDYVGGFPGMAMTMRDTGRTKLCLLGPSSCMQQLVDSANSFLIHERLQFECVSFSDEDEKPFEDDNVTIHPVVTTSGCPSHYHDCGFQSLSTDDDSNDDETPNPAKRHCCEFKAGDAVSYICQLKTLRGKFLPQKALALGVPKGHLFGSLQRGNSIVLENGKKVNPEDVMELYPPVAGFIIIECPTKEHMQQLTKHPKFTPYQNNNKQPMLLVHFTPMDMFTDSAYQTWMKSFGDKAHHIILNETVCAPKFVFTSQSAIQCKLNTIHNKIFPVLYQRSNKENVHCLPSNCTVGENLLKFHLKPLKVMGFDRSEIPAEQDGAQIMRETIDLLKTELTKEDLDSINITTTAEAEPTRLGSHREETSLPRKDTNTEPEEENFHQDLCANENNANRDCVEDDTDEQMISDQNEFRTSVETCQEKEVGKENVTENHSIMDNLSHETCKQDHEQSNSTGKELYTSSTNQCCPVEDSFDPEIVFLGTGASLPSKYRNVSCTLVQISENKIILLDAGEGSYGQIFRHFGEKTDEVLKNMTAVFISHIHADHHLGLLRIMLKRQSLVPDDQPLVVIAPKNLKSWLQQYDQVFEKLNCLFIDSADLLTEDCGFRSVLDTAVGHCKVQPVKVEHCKQACGLVLEHSSGWKLVFSGDTRPCENLIKEGQDATVLIHEATLDDELEDQALVKMHSTTSEAIDVGVKMKAKFTLLNHFSQRYPKIPVFGEQFSDSVGVAFDHMKVKFSQLHQLPKLLPALKVIFAEEMEELKSKV